MKFNNEEEFDNQGKPFDEDGGAVDDGEDREDPPGGDDVVNSRPSRVQSDLASVEVVDGNSMAVMLNYNPNMSGTGDDGPLVAQFKDHFTLLIPSSTVRYREKRSAARVIEADDSQFVLEETYHPQTGKQRIEIRRIPDTSEGVRVLRMSYTLITTFWTGFLFIFCLQILLLLVLDLALYAGKTSNQGAQWGKAFGSLVSIPGFVYGLASALVIAGAFILDTWRGHYLIRNFAFSRLSSTFVEWIFFFFFLGLPVVVLCGALLARVDNWWDIAGLVWVSDIMGFYAIFTVNVIFYEMRACWEVTKNRFQYDDDSRLELVRRSILLRQVSSYGGRETVSYISKGSFINVEATDKHARDNMVAGTERKTKSFWTRFTNWKLLSTKGGLHLFEPVEERIFTIDDARDVRPYLTSYTWSLEKVFCRPRNSRYIAIVKGPGAITRSQMRSSMACSLLGSGLMLLLLLSILIYLQLGPQFTWLMITVGVILCLPTFISTYKLYDLARDLKLVDHAAEREDFSGPRLIGDKSEGVYLVQEVWRVTRPTEAMCWIMFALEICFFFFWPLLSLFAVNNYPLALTFLVVAGLTGLRYYVNASVVLEETGHMDLVNGNTEAELWKNQSRLNEIVGNISRGRSGRAWMGVLGAFGFVFVALLYGAVGLNQQSQTTFDTPFTYVPDFYYEQKDSLRYPTCQLTSDLGSSPLKSMADYAFLAGLAYRGIGNVTQNELDGWFGEGVATEQAGIVQNYRDEFQVQSAVSFKLVTVQSKSLNDTRPFAYVLIRGTTNPWDMLADAQLWSAAFLYQIWREILPLGSMWTPIGDQLINALTTLQSVSVSRISFYKDTTKFINWVKSQPDYQGVAITGHSLGGGLSIISGSQTKTAAVALSGPNSMLSRKSFDPPITPEDLDTYTFNIIPERDVVPMIDDRANNYQKIRCQTEYVDVVGCHDSTRSLCEIIFMCGTNGRPVPCECYTQYQYPPPESSSTSRSFNEACGI